MPAPCGPLWTPVSGASLSPGKGAQGCSRSRTCSDKRPSADIGPPLFGPFFFPQPAPPAFDIGTLQLDRIGAATGPRRSEEHTTALQFLMRISFDSICFEKTLNHNLTKDMS